MSRKREQTVVYQLRVQGEEQKKRLRISKVGQRVDIYFQQRVTSGRVIDS